MSSDNTSNATTFDAEKHGKNFLIGSAIGLTGMIISSLSSEITGHKLGYGNIGLKNGFKIIISSGLTTVLVMKAEEKYRGQNTPSS